MILGLCSSFAVVPAVSLFTGNDGGSRRLVGPARSSADPSDSSDAGSAEGLASLLMAKAAFSAASQSPDVASGVLAASTESPAGAPAQVAASPTPAAAPAPATAAAAASRPTAAPAPAVKAPVAPAAPVVVAPPARSAPAVVARPAPAGRSNQGVASWLDISAGTCANNDAPMGTVITVTNSLGVSVTCKVVSRGPFVSGRIVDLARSNFAALGSVSRGLVTVAVTW
jgi:rare lipoprotein A (peptidoglycan hydrolase)